MKKSLILCSVFCLAFLFFPSCEPIDKSPAEIIVTTSNGQIAAESSAESLTFSYEVNNPKDGGMVTLEIPETNDWISNPVIDENAKTITVSLTENLAPENRQEIITIRYTYGKNSVTGIASILQEGNSYDYVLDCTYSKSLYYGQGMVVDLSLHCYYFRVSNNDFNAETKAHTWRYSIDFYFAGEAENRLPEPGTYHMAGLDEETSFSFSTWGTKAEYIGEDLIDGTDYESFVFVDGKAVIEREDGIYTMTAVLTDLEGKRHYIHYVGEPELEDATILSTLEGDVEVELKNYALVLMDYGDYYEMGMNNWQLQIYSGPSEGEFILFLDVVTPFSVDLSMITEPVLFESYYANTGATDCFYLPGEYKFQLSWLVTWAGYGMDYISPYAAILGGSCLLEPNDDGTVRLTTDFVDQHGNKIKLTVDDMPIYYYLQYGSASTAGKHNLAF